MALVQPPVLERKRVKVYELKRNDWHDRGTGFCMGTLINDEPHLHVDSEDEPTRTLLETKISKDDGYQKQQDTLIVWTEGSVTDMALSFQEAEGCAAIWEFVSEAQQRMGGGVEDGFSDDLSETLLPPPDLGNLVEIENMMRMCNSNAGGREQLTQFIVTKDYLQKLVPLVEIAEDLESLQDLHRLCNIVKTITLLNDTNVMDRVVSDECWMGVIGALEYDPDFPNHKANHRLYLSDTARFREVVKVEDADIKLRFYKCYRLQYLKDVILARIIDDPTFGTINGAIYYHQVEIIGYIQNNTNILKELFGIFGDSKSDGQRRKDAVSFIQQACAILKAGQPIAARQALFQQFIAHGLFHVIAFSLSHAETSVRIAGSDILNAVIEHDITLVRGQIMRAVGDEKSKPLTDVLIGVLLSETDLGVQTVLSEATRSLLDPSTMFQGPLDANGRPNMELMTKMRIAQFTGQADITMQRYYEDCWRKLSQPIRDLEETDDVSKLSIQKVALFSHLLDMFATTCKQYSNRSKLFSLAEPLAPRVAQLLSSPEKHLKLAALKYFRICIGLHDQAHYRLFVQHRLFDHILNVLFETMPRDNLLNSVCLELFEFIKRENLKELTIHLVETYRDKLEAITYVETFRQLIEKYEKLTAPMPDNLSFTSVDTEATPHRGTIANGASRWQPGLKDTDAEEEAYFNGSDNEDEEETFSILKSIPNGASPIKPLVNYPEEDDEDGIDILAQADSMPARSTTLVESVAPPLERISEKRRREEDEEEDELGKLSGTHTPKRRTSVSSVESNKSARVLRRKGGANSGKDGGGGGGGGSGGGAGAGGGEKGTKQISINIAAKGDAEDVVDENEE